MKRISLFLLLFLLLKATVMYAILKPTSGLFRYLPMQLHWERMD